MGYIIVIVILVVILAYIGLTYNNLVTLRNRVKDQWAQIDVQLKRRFDLIPNLVSTVKGYASHESETLEKVIEARNKFQVAKTPKEEMDANNELSNMVSKIFALAESYPDLKANTSFQELQKELGDTENKIASARQFYNDTVLTYNNKVEMFPSNLIAGMFKFVKEAFFEAAAKEKENVQVKF